MNSARIQELRPVTVTVELLYQGVQKSLPLIGGEPFPCEDVPAAVEKLLYPMLPVRRFPISVFVLFLLVWPALRRLGLVRHVSGISHPLPPGPIGCESCQSDDDSH